MKKISAGIAASGLIAIILLCSYFAGKAEETYKAESNAHAVYSVFKPVPGESAAKAAEAVRAESTVPPPAPLPVMENSQMFTSIEETEQASQPEQTESPQTGEYWPQSEGWGEPEYSVNENIQELKAQYPDAIGWLTIAGTSIDYPFVQGADNDFYLHHNLDDTYATAGSIFMDYRNYPDFSDVNTILYGHHMKNGTMFASLKRFNDESFFNTVSEGIIYLENKTYSIEFFAYLVVPSDDQVVFGMVNANDSQMAETHLSYIKEKARHYRDINITPGEPIVTLSTCAYDFGDARMVLLGRLR
jgi:sortase B